MTQLLFPLQAFAGGGPENVLLVMNSSDQDSLAIGNYFASLRQVPAGSHLLVDWQDAPFKTDLNTFRQRLLTPILDAITERKLEEQIDYIIYSSGFPYAVDLSSESAPTARPHLASLTSLTYFYQMVRSSTSSETPKADNRIRQASNLYARNLLPNSEVGSRGFRARFGIDSLGERTQDDAAPRFYLSMMLGATRGQQTNTVKEVLSYLKRGKEADGTRPKGTIYFVRNNNIRSTVRHNKFADAVLELKQLGVQAEEIEGQAFPKECLPFKKPDVMGAMIGMHSYAWQACQSQIMPGAICENFTSYGGVLDGSKTNVQTLLCDFLRYGAVASSGTVMEPFAISAKFPHPQMHVHYARGCSVAEAFYQSVPAPYQLVIVGDPLCQPWAQRPKVKIRNLQTKQAIRGPVEFELDLSSPASKPIKELEIYLDGRLATRLSPPRTTVRLNTDKLANGYHELRVVAIEDSPIETQGRAISGFVLMNPPKNAARDGGTPVAKSGPATKLLTGVSAKVSPKNQILKSGKVGHIDIDSRHASEVRLYRGHQLLGSVTGSSGRFSIDAEKLGKGPVTLTPVAVPSVPEDKTVYGFPIKLQIQ